MERMWHWTADPDVDLRWAEELQDLNDSDEDDSDDGLEGIEHIDISTTKGRRQKDDAELSLSQGLSLTRCRSHIVVSNVEIGSADAEQPLEEHCKFQPLTKAWTLASIKAS